MDKPKEILLIACLFFLNLAFRFSLISIGPYHSDCLLLATHAAKILETGQMLYLQGPGMPLTALCGAGFVGLFRIIGISDPVLAVNTMSVVFSSLSIIALYLFVRSQINLRTAFLSALIFSFDPLFLGVSTFGNSHALSIFLLLTGLYFMSEHKRKGKNYLLVLSAFFFGLCGASRLQDYIITAVPIIIFFYLFGSKDKIFKSIKSNILPLLGLSAFVIFLFYLPALLSQTSPPSSAAMNIVSSRFLNQFNILSFEILIKIIQIYFDTFSPIEWLLAAAGISLLFKDNRPLAIALLIWLLLPLTLFPQLRFFVPRLIVHCNIAIAIAAAYSLDCCSQKKLLKYICLILTMVAVIFNLSQFLPTIAFRHQFALLPDFFVWVKNHTEENAYIIERDHSLFIEYYARRKPLNPNIQLYGIAPGALQEFKDKVDPLLSAGVPVYITKYGILGTRHFETLRKFLLDNYSFKYIGSRPVEDWHLGVLYHVVIGNDLLKIERKQD